MSTMSAALLDVHLCLTFTDAARDRLQALPEDDLRQQIMHQYKKWKRLPLMNSDHIRYQGDRLSIRWNNGAGSMLHKAVLKAVEWAQKDDGSKEMTAWGITRIDVELVPRGSAATSSAPSEVLDQEKLTVPPPTLPQQVDGGIVGPPSQTGTNTSPRISPGSNDPSALLDGSPERTEAPPAPSTAFNEGGGTASSVRHENAVCSQLASRDHPGSEESQQTPSPTIMHAVPGGTGAPAQPQKVSAPVVADQLKRLQDINARQGKLLRETQDVLRQEQAKRRQLEQENGNAAGYIHGLVGRCNSNDTTIMKASNERRELQRQLTYQAQLRQVLEDQAAMSKRVQAFQDRLLKTAEQKTAAAEQKAVAAEQKVAAAERALAGERQLREAAEQKLDARKAACRSMDSEIVEVVDAADGDTQQICLNSGRSPVSSAGPGVGGDLDKPASSINDDITDRAALTNKRGLDAVDDAEEQQSKIARRGDAL